MSDPIPHEPANPGRKLGAATRDYLERLIRNLEPLSFGSPFDDDPLNRDAQLGRRISLKKAWVPRHISSANGNRADTTIGVGELVTSRMHAVVTGEPGSGKSTICSWVALNTAEQALGAGGRRSIVVPLILNLARCNHDGAWKSLQELVSLAIQGTDQSHDTNLVTEILDLASSGLIYFVLDGLDEVSESLTHEVLQAIEILTESSRAWGCRLLVTCRTYDYGLPGVQLPLSQYRLEPLTDDQLYTYVERWHDAAEQSVAIRMPDPEKRHRIHRLINESNEVRDLARTPLLVTVLCMVGSELERRDVSRATLYAKAIRFLLSDRPAWRDGNNDARTLVSADRLQRVAQRVALRMYEIRLTAPNDVDTQPLVIGYQDLQRLVEEAINAFSGSIVQIKVRRREVDEIMGRLVGETSNGLFVDQGGLCYSFAHRSFQEMLTALEFAHGGKSIPDLVAYALDPQWREVFRLLALHASEPGQTITWILTLIQELASLDLAEYDDPSAVRGVLIAAEMLVEIGSGRLAKQWPMAVQSHDAARKSTAFRGLWNSLRDQMFVLAEQQSLAIALRIRALELAGYLGDPRLAKADLTEANDGDRMIAIAGGRYRFGMRQPIKFVGPKRVEAWPQRSVDLKPFRMARYPVTNSEYKLFLADGGYDTDRWWLEPEARAWMRQDESFIGKLIQLWMQWYPKHYYKPEEDQLIGAMTPEGAARRILRRRQPLYWHDSRFNAPNYPVVGINWWEARAYCRWLTAYAQAGRLIDRGRVVRLPTEWEWECAAGRYDLGISSVYPWGDEFDPAACHTRFGSLSRLSPIPVGFLRYEGSNRFPADVIGNVWEWVSSRCLSYESKNDAIREDPADVSADRVVRGSSWYSTEPSASQIRFRLHDQICNAYWDLGFRYVIADADEPDRVIAAA